MGVSNPVASFNLDPDAELDFGIDWGSWLDDGDTISTSSWAIAVADGGSALSPPVFGDGGSSGSIVPGTGGADRGTACWVDGAGATEGRRYDLTNSVLSAGGREDDRTIRIVIVER